MPSDLTLPHRSSPMAEWPETYRAQWDRALAPADFLDEPGGAAHWSPASVRKTAKGFGYFLAWAAKQHLPVGAALQTLVAPDAVRSYLGTLQTARAGYTVACRAQELYDAVRVMAPEQDWTWLLDAVKAAEARAYGIRDKHGRLRPAPALEALGLRLMDEAGQSDRLTILQRAVLYRDGLIIALLARRPLRIRNFAALRLGVDLVETAGEWRIAIPARETKSKRALEAAVPEVLVAHLLCYIERHRPVLLAQRGQHQRAEDHLWIAETGQPLAEISLHYRVRQHTAEAFGAPIPPHWFRDAATTLIVLGDPVHAMITKGLLGHATPDIAEQHYNRALAIDSSRRHAALVEALMADHDGNSS
jgi:hypothetical protein